MTRYVKVSFLATLIGFLTLPGYVSAASITETRAAIGKGCVTDAPFSTAMGYYTEATFEASTAMGSFTTASGYVSTAMGSGTTASGYVSTAMGSGTIASGNYSTAMGYVTVASGYYSTAMGQRTHAFSAYETVIGSYPTTYSPASTTGWEGSDRLFVIGNGPKSDHRSNAMVVLKNGNIGIGETAPSKRLYVNGSAGGTQEWNASDGREKTEIKPIENALGNILEIRGISYRWKRGDEKESQGFDNKTHFGVIAQEVEAVYPQLVDNPGITEKRKHVEYNGFVGILIEAVKELKEMNDAQQAEIEELRSMIKDLRTNHQQIAKRETSAWANLNR